MSLLHAHLVFVTEHRRNVFTDATLTYCEHTVREVCTEPAAELVEFNSQTDHVHRLVSYPPTSGISAPVQRLKARTASAVCCEYTGARARMHGHLWHPSNLAVSCRGAPLTIIRQHIDGQARPLRPAGCARPTTGWAHPGLQSEACTQKSGHQTLQASRNFSANSSGVSSP